VPKTPWSNFIYQHPAAHLIAGIVPEEDVVAASPRRLILLLSKLLSRLGLSGSYALTVDRQNATPEIHCVFEHEIDAWLEKPAHLRPRYQDEDPH
jgi:hypothetical protein